MSSRNVYLGEERRKTALVLHEALSAAEDVYKGGDVERKGILDAARKVIDRYLADGAKIMLDYLSLAEPGRLEEIDKVEGPGAVMSMAVMMLPCKEGDLTVRLIDNVILP